MKLRRILLNRFCFDMVWTMSKGGIMFRGNVKICGRVSPAVCLGNNQTEAEVLQSKSGHGNALLRRMASYLLTRSVSHIKNYLQPFKNNDLYLLLTNFYTHGIIYPQHCQFCVHGNSVNMFLIRCPSVDFARSVCDDLNDIDFSLIQQML